MARVQKLAAVFSALAGGAIAAGGWPGLHLVLVAALDAIPLVFLVIGVLALISTLAPPGSWWGPALVIAVGAFLLARQSGQISGAWLQDAAAPTLNGERS